MKLSEINWEFKFDAWVDRLHKIEYINDQYEFQLDYRHNIAAGHVLFDIGYYWGQP